MIESILDHVDALLPFHLGMNEAALAAEAAAAEVVVTLSADLLQLLYLM